MSSRAAARKDQWIAFGATLLVGLALVRPFMRLVASYWAFFRMGAAGGNGMALFYMVAPLGVLVAVLSAVLAFRVAAAARVGPARAIGVGALSLGVAFALLFALEAWRTADYPTESGEAVSVVAFLHHYTGL